MTRVPACDDPIAAFGRWLTREGRSPGTVRTYCSEIGALEAWAAPTPLSELAAGDLERYLRERLEGGASPSSHNVRVAALRAFYEWYSAGAGRRRGNIAAGLKTMAVAEGETAHLSRDAVRALLGVLEGNLRDTAIMLLVLSTGIKVSELVAADRDDLRYGEEGVELLIKRAGEWLPVYPSAQASDALKAYLASRNDDNEALFVSRNGRRLAVRTIQGGFARHFKAAGLKGSLRTLRHTFGVHRSEAGMELSHVQRLLGLRTARSVERYRLSQSQDLRAAARYTEQRY